MHRGNALRARRDNATALGSVHHVLAVILLLFLLGLLFYSIGSG
jgi:hypothetical protein